MERYEDERLPAELAEVAQRMRDERPRLEPLELDRIKLRAQSTARRRVRHKEAVLKSRLAIMAVLVTGVLMSGAGAGLAVSGLSGDGSAGSAQYTTDTQTVAPTTEISDPTNGDDDRTGDDTSGNDPAQATRQVGTGGGDELPFTGFAAIPVLLIGVALLAMGGVMRRRVRDED